MKLGLALSGGGFRAAAFHLGTLKKLKELNILDDVDVISTVSGGSIIGAYYALNHQDFEEFEKGFRAGLKKSMLTASILHVSTVGLIILALPFILASLGWYYLFAYLPLIFLLLKFQFNLLPFSWYIQKRYSSVFYQNKTLGNLPSKPELLINSTNVETGRPFIFSRTKMGDSTYEYPTPGKKKITFKHLSFPVSKAVMASSCVPFAFTPVKISKQFFTNPDDMQRVKPMLIDGGVYDNQGAHRLCHAGSVYECNTVIVSDAGTGFKPLTKMNNTLMLLMQTSELFMNRIKNFQFISNLILNKYYGKKIIAYLSLSNKPEECIAFFVDLLKGGKIMDEVIESHRLTSEKVSEMPKQELINYLKERINYSEICKSIPSKELHQKALNIGTNLTALNDDKINALVVVAKVLTELQVKLYCPGLIV